MHFVSSLLYKNALTFSMSWPGPVVRGCSLTLGYAVINFWVYRCKGFTALCLATCSGRVAATGQRELKVTHERVQVQRRGATTAPSDALVALSEIRDP